MSKVYSLAYQQKTRVNLCTSHADAPPRWMPPLGACVDGTSHGPCIACACGNDRIGEAIRLLAEHGMITAGQSDRAIAGSDSGTALYAAQTIADGYLSLGPVAEATS